MPGPGQWRNARAGLQARLLQPWYFRHWFMSPKSPCMSDNFLAMVYATIFFHLLFISPKNWSYPLKALLCILRFGRLYCFYVSGLCACNLITSILSLCFCLHVCFIVTITFNYDSTCWSCTATFLPIT